MNLVQICNKAQARSGSSLGGMATRAMEMSKNQISACIIDTQNTYLLDLNFPLVSFKPKAFPPGYLFLLKKERMTYIYTTSIKGSIATTIVETIKYDKRMVFL